MAEPNGALEKSTLHQFENGADLRQHKEIADASASSLGSPTFEGVDENAVLRKMDIRLIPMLSMLYLLAFLDRGNIGNAKIEGLVDDLHMTGPQYNWTCMNLLFAVWLDFVRNILTVLLSLVTVFFFTYCVFELPSNLLLKKLRPSRWLPLIMVAWGIVMVCNYLAAESCLRMHIIMGCSG
jgi:hypothetical protein